MHDFVCVFEDKKFSNFFPLSLSHPVFELRVGFGNLRLRLLEELSPAEHGVICRDYLADLMQIKYPELTINDKSMELIASKKEAAMEDILFLNGRLLCYGNELETMLSELPENSIAVKGGYVVAARLKAAEAEAFVNFIRKRISSEAIERLCGELKSYVSKTPQREKSKVKKEVLVAENPDEGTFEDDHELGQDNLLEKLPKALSDIVGNYGIRIIDMNHARLLSFPWQIIEENASVIEDDFAKLAIRGRGDECIVCTGVQMVGEENIVIGEASVIKPGAVLDASTGPIIIGDGTMVMANATLNGPVYIGKQSLIKPGAKILEGTSIGDVCKIGGEVEGTIFAAYSNKQHDGFMGHSYIGEWVNIGAGTNNSDLKNNYSPVRMWCAGEIRETGRQFLGLLIGDHTKTGINTMFNTGTVIGFNCNFFGSEPPAKFVPSFAWGYRNNFEVYDLEKGMQTAETVMERRNVKFTKAHRELFRKLFEFSKKSSRNI